MCMVFDAVGPTSTVLAKIDAQRMLRPGRGLGNAWPRGDQYVLLAQKLSDAAIYRPIVL
jgi:hypothetical protein